MVAIKSDVKKMPVKALRSLIVSHRNTDSATGGRVGSIIRKARPSIPINNGSIVDESLLAITDDFPHWADTSNEIVNDFSASVARLEVEHNPEDNPKVYHPVGTCFLVSTHGRVRMATAGHMLKSLLIEGSSVRKSRPVKPRRDPLNPQRDPLRKARVNFHDAGAEDPDHIIHVKEPWVWAHPRWDLLLFDLDIEPGDIKIMGKKPLPLEQETGWWQGSEVNEICVLGYPIDDSDEPVINIGESDNQIMFIFGDTGERKLAIKRISPGLCDKPKSVDKPPPTRDPEFSTIKRDRSTIDHDASTLPGNSGSPIFSLRSKKVIGLHYDGGRYVNDDGEFPDPPPENNFQLEPWNNAVNIPVALLEDELRESMSDPPAIFNGRTAIRWDPGQPLWKGKGSLELSHQINQSLIPAAGSPVLKSVVADRPDFRDHMYRPSLVKADDELIPSNKSKRFIRNQVDVPACTAFAVAAAINVQLHELGRGNEPVSEQMLYAMATLHDEWIDDRIGGSSLRGAIKGFYQNGVCRDSAAPLTANGLNWSLSRDAALQARSITLGAYNRLRPNLLDFQLALNEVGAIVVSAHVHKGWTSKKGRKKGKISPGGKRTGTHAFVILGYVNDGFIIQNSWGERWSNWNGHPGLAHWHYDDWADNLIDAWVLRLAPSTPRAFDLVPKIASQHLLLQSDGNEENQLPALPRQRRFSLIGHVCQIERDRFINDGRLGMGLDSLRETALFLRSDSAQKKYPTIAFFFHDPLLGRDNIGKLCAWMIKPFKKHGIYPIHIVYGIDEARTMKLRVEHECREIKQRFGAVEQDLSFYVERRISQLMQPLIKVFQEGIESAVLPGNSIWQSLASICLENNDSRNYCAFASGIGYRILMQLTSLFEKHNGASEQEPGYGNVPLFEQKLSDLFLLAPSATLEMINTLGIANNISLCALANEKEPSNQLQGYCGDWIDLTARVTGLEAYGTPAVRGSEEINNLGVKFTRLQAQSKTLHTASAEAEVLNTCLKMFCNQKFKRKFAFE